MPRTTVTLIARTKTVRSSRRIAQTANWQVNELRISRIVAGPTNGRMPCERARVELLGRPLRGARPGC